jgi:hypothetical protein
LLRLPLRSERRFCQLARCRRVLARGGRAARQPQRVLDLPPSGQTLGVGELAKHIRVERGAESRPQRGFV